MVCRASTEVGDTALKGQEDLAKRPYSNPYRLPDVLALIQVLSLDEYTHRTESGMMEELQFGPVSSDSWTSLAKEHPEFFRLGSGDKNIALIARHVMPRGVDGKKPKLPTEVMQKLFQTAIDIRDRQLNAKEWWKPFVPALIAGILGIVASLATIWLRNPKCP